MKHIYPLNVCAVAILSLVLNLVPWAAFAQRPGETGFDTTSLSISQIKKLSVEDLMNVEVTSVSKRPQKLSDVASAIQVITQEDIHRSGATSLPEALKLAPNLQVARYNSYAWIITARGFGNVFSNKLLVMIDGRTVYSPLFAGVYWDIQSVLLEDVERIEVISGPGGTLWGANAVNGVINIITKKAKNTPGLYLSASAGNQVHDQFSARYGGKIGSSVSYRVYGQQSKFDPTLNATGQSNNDNWNLIQGGFQIGYDPGGSDQITLQANFMGGKEYTKPGPSTFDEQDAMIHWNHVFSQKSDMQVQAYYNRTWRRDLPSTFNDQLETYDINVQHHVQVGNGNNLLYGAEYRLINDDSQNTTPVVGFVPPVRTLHLYNVFVQDEIQLIGDALKMTLGTKLLNDMYTGFEWQPSARLTWTPNSTQTIWGAVSRAVRTPSRIDVDYRIPTYPVSANTQNVGGGPNFVSEKLLAYELGYRIQPSRFLSLSLATFYNVYNDLYSVEVVPGTKTYLIQNGMEGNSQGVELSGLYQPTSYWRLRGGYTFLHKNIRDKPGHSFDPNHTGVDPRHQAVLQSMFEMFKHFQLDVVGRYVSGRPRSVSAGVPVVNEYANLDVRVAWHQRKMEFAVVGQDILNSSHVEFAFNRIPRSIYAKATYRF